MTAIDISTLKAKYEAAGQGHVFTYWDSLAEAEQAEYAAQLAAIDPARVNRIHATAMAASAIDTSTTKIEPLPSSVFLSAASASPDQLNTFREAGLAAIKAGQVAVLLMAGGQGTRLGSKDPKGCFDIKLPSAKSLFQLQAERLARLQTVAGGKLPWYVMVSGPTRKDTVAFFDKHGYFGLDKANVHFFEQGTLPALTKDGKIFLEAKHRLAVAPDGNGGVYAALESAGILAHMKAHGVEYIHAYCVDNCLVKVADPVFLGYNIVKGAEVGAKTVRKTDPEEPVGVVCLRNGKYGVVEYSEIPAEVSAARNPADGALLLSAANIANHFYTRAFLERVKEFEDKLEYHVAHKKIAHVDLASGETVAPSTPNGVKMELFIFDVFPFTDSFAVFEGERRDEFSPLKNKDGVDSPATSRRDILDLHHRYLEAAGATFAEGAEVEISPLVSYAGEGLDAYKGKTFEGVTHLH
ncbi:UDP-N-acetylglucosamine pyrophosphorylase [Blastocladiella emersonii ATCC 22665]|nr:UDP-N-acetylglucosamine pyrophosphorylase [Blastocladiella emersonii ATCC 22665]